MIGQNVDKDACFFCDLSSSDLRQVMTYKVDKRVRQCAALLGDHLLIGKLNIIGDMIAKEAKYQSNILLTLYYKAGHVQSHEVNVDTTSSVTDHVQAESLALAEVISYMEDTKLGEVTPSVFKLSELSRFYSSILTELGSQLVDTQIYLTRLKE